MAKAAGISSTTVHKLWAANDLKPHLTRTFKLSNDPHFEDDSRIGKLNHHMSGTAKCPADSLRLER